MTTSANTTAAMLAAYLAGRAERPARPFEWASNNCCHFAAEWVHYATRRNPMATLDTTADARAALRMVRRLGGSLRAAWSQQLGRAPIDAALAQTGDVVLLPTAALTTPEQGKVGHADEADHADEKAGVGHVAGVCNGRHAVVVDRQGHAHFVPLYLADAAFRLHGTAGGGSTQGAP